MQTRSLVLLSLLLAACSPQLTVVETCHHNHGTGGSGTGGGDTTSSTTDSSTTASSSSGGPQITCIIDTGECQMDGGPANIGGACKTTIYSPMPNGHCDNMGNCCRPLFQMCSADAECQTGDPCGTDTCASGYCRHVAHPDGTPCTMFGGTPGKCLSDVCK